MRCERCALRGSPCAFCYADAKASTADCISQPPAPSGAGRAPYLRSVHGHKIDLLHPQNTPIDIVEIGHALSRICRFGGHLKPGVYWSVASHSVLVSFLVPHELAVPALLHDASESYLGSDIPRPLKQLLPEYKRIEHRWTRRIQDAFGVPVRPGDAAAIKHADDEAYAIEKRDLMAPARDAIGADDRDEIKASPLYEARSTEHGPAKAAFLGRAYALGLLPGAL